MGPDLYSTGGWDELSEEQKAEFLKSFAPEATNVGGAPRGYEALAPKAPRGIQPTMATAEGRASVGESEEAALMRRFMEAQQQGNRRDSVNAWASGTGQDIANFVNGGSYGRGTYVNSIARDTSLRQQPVEDVKAQEAAKANLAAQKRRAETDARDAEADSARVDKMKADTQRAEMTAAEDEALSRVDSPETNAEREAAHELLMGRISAEKLAKMNGHQIRFYTKPAASQINAEVMAGYKGDAQALAEQRAELDKQLRLAGLSIQERELILRQRGLELDAERIAAQQAKADATATRGTAIPGYAVAPGAAPTPDDAKKVKAGLVSSEKLKANIRELRSLFNQHGTEYTGPIATRMRQLSTAILLEAKTVGELGALTGPDMGVITALSSSDPGSLKANVKEIVGLDETAAGLDGLEKWVDESVYAGLKVYGYQPERTRQPVAPTADSSPPPNAAPRREAPKTAPTSPPLAEARPGDTTRIRGTGTQADPMQLRVAGKPSGYIASMLGEGEFAFVSDLDGGRLLVKKDGKVKYADGKPAPRKMKGK